MSRFSELEAAIAGATGKAFAARSIVAASGGCIHDSVIVGDGERRYFVKRGEPSRVDMFEAEAHGLDALRSADGIRVPEVVHCGVCDARSVLVLEHIDMQPLAGNASSRLGAVLAGMHAIVSDCHGFDRDNYIGATPQRNEPSRDWPAFFRERRLRPQLAVAVGAGYAAALETRGARLIECVDALLDGHAPSPSLLHGDLWGGNAASDAEGTPVLFDPAAYHGDRETDIAMTELFGGFPRAFRDAYESAWPLPPGYRVRRTLYNLYHVLNHLNLFGGGYLRQSRDDIDWLLAHAR